MKRKAPTIGIAHNAPQTRKEISGMCGNELVATVDGQPDSVRFDRSTQVEAAIRRVQNLSDLHPDAAEIRIRPA